jgi:DNA-binding CsgD family transcriptional regulator
MGQATLRSEAQIVAELLACAEAGAGPAPEAPEPGGEVVLEVVVDGASYQLVRHEDRRDAFRDVRLSPRELEIARLIANGHTNRTIAVVLDISPWTVSAHVRRVFAKLDVGSRAAMIGKLVADGFLAPAPDGRGGAQAGRG